MEGGRKEEEQSKCARLVSAPAKFQRGGKRHSIYFPQFIWLGPSKDREARVNTLKRCAIASTLGPSESTPEVVQGILREVYNFEYPWKAVLVGPRTYLIEFPSISILEKAAIGQVLFGSNNALVVRRWEENIGAHGTLQRFWVRISGLPRECWGWDDVKGILDYFCKFEKMECVEATRDNRDYVRALIVTVGPELFPIFVRVGINSQLHDVYIHAETGQSMHLSEPQQKHSASQLASGLPVPSDNKWRSVRVKTGYIVPNEPAESIGAIQSMSFTGPYVPNSLEAYSKGIGPSRLSREGHSKDEARCTANQGMKLYLRCSLSGLLLPFLPRYGVHMHKDIY